MSVFVLGDVHGAYKALNQVLERANFNTETDKLIFLGDVCDGFPEIKQCMKLFMKLKNFVFIRGNHDDIALSYYLPSENRLLRDSDMPNWKKLEGSSTIKSVGKREVVKDKYLEFLKSSVLYHFEGNLAFSHGMLPEIHSVEEIDALQEQTKETFLMRRYMVYEAYANRNNPLFRWGSYFKQIYVGHTPVQKLEKHMRYPHTYGNVTLMDTGARQGFKLSLKNITTGEVFQSDMTRELYR